MLKAEIPRAVLRTSTSLSSAAKPKRARLLIVGTGWSGYSLLRSIDKRYFDVLVLSKRNHFLFTPLLCSTTVGTLEFRSIIEPVRNAGFRVSSHFHNVEVQQVHFGEKTVECRSVLDESASESSNQPFKVSYDLAVLACGSVANTFGVPGASEHAFFLKEVRDARAIRSCIVRNFERALQPMVDETERRRLLNFVIVGGGPTGVEFAAELHDFVRQDVPRLFREEAGDVRVTLIESRDILPVFDKGMRDFAERKLRKRSEFRLIKHAVTRVTPRSVVLSNGEELPCGMVVWTAGISPAPLVRSLHDVRRDDRSGRLVTDRHFALQFAQSGSQPQFRDVYALGDCASIEGMTLPCTAQIAEREGRYLAQSLTAVGKEFSRSGQLRHPQELGESQFVYKHLGMLTYIGGYKALSEVHDLRFKGFFSWLLWRSAYLTRLGSWRLRMQVPVDWLKTLLFGRDISRF